MAVTLKLSIVLMWRKRPSNPIQIKFTAVQRRLFDAKQVFTSPTNCAQFVLEKQTIILLGKKSNMLQTYYKVWSDFVFFQIGPIYKICLIFLRTSNKQNFILHFFLNTIFSFFYFFSSFSSLLTVCSVKCILCMKVFEIVDRIIFIFIS